MNNDHFTQLIAKSFSHEPTSDQLDLIQKLDRFLLDDVEDPIMVVRGYAGTGKTSLIAALVRVLPKIGFKSLLMAPTGRAAKVLSGYAKKPAYTIHKVIYYSGNKGGKMVFQLKKNLRKKTVFIIDEASMIPDGSQYENKLWGSGNGLLEDLFSYAFSGESCKVILVGDNAQLPPVYLDESPAMDFEYLKRNYDLLPVKSTLKEVIRQSKTSGILYNATSLRLQLEKNKNVGIHFSTENFDDLTIVNGPEVQELLDDAYGKFGTENTIVLCRSNKRANLYNQQIRIKIKWLEEEISAGDLLMVVKNNYHWLDDDSAAGFIANGDIIEIMSVRGTQEIYGFRFADVMIRMVDYPDQPEIEVKIILDSIMSETAALSSEDGNKLYQAVLEDYTHISDKRKRYLQMKKDPFMNALQVKFAYAITCHKSQGGQWDAVFIDQGYLKPEMINKEYLRWLYTAMTRASQKLYFVNFNPTFFN